MRNNRDNGLGVRLRKRLELLTDYKISQDIPGKKRQYPFGTVVKYDEAYCLVSFFHLIFNNGCIPESLSDTKLYKERLSLMWKHLVNLHLGKCEVNIPLIGGNFMPLGKLSLSQERIIDYMLESFFEVARDGCTWKKLRICVGEKVVPYVNFDEYQSIMRHYYEKSLI